MVHRGQEKGFVLFLRVHAYDLLVEVCLDALYQLKVHKLIWILGVLDSHDYFTTFHHSKLAYRRKISWLVLLLLVLIGVIQRQPFDHLLYSVLVLLMIPLRAWVV